MYFRYSSTRSVLYLVLIRFRFFGYKNIRIIRLFFNFGFRFVFFVSFRFGFRFLVLCSCLINSMVQKVKNNRKSSKDKKNKNKIRILTIIFVIVMNFHIMDNFTIVIVIFNIIFITYL